jgi:ABC-2 type transport system permease protein
VRHAHQALVVAGWEFRRYFRWKDQLMGLGLFLLIGAVWVGAVMVAGAKGRTMTVAVVGLDLAAPEEGRIRFVPAPPDTAQRADALRRGDVQGILTRRADGTFDLLVEKDPRYRAELIAVLAESVRRERLAAAGVTAEGLERILAPAPLEVRFTNPATGRRGTPEKIAAGVFIGILLLAVFTSMAYLMTGIAGEKQLRVTESVVSAISPQAWIDGKVLGITGFALASVAGSVAAGLVVALGARMATGFTLPAAAVRPGVVLALGAFTLLGLLLWNSFFAAVASTMDDPNTSSRSSLLMLPALPVVMSIAILRDPDSVVSRALALVPLTSAPALPMRLVLSDPGMLEIGASAALLIAAIWFMRRMAGRIFEVGMLLYGKEPTLREIGRWAAHR